MIIGICGKKRSGKDTIAEYLVKTYAFVRMGLADPMKEACKHIFLFEDEQLWGDKKEVVDERYGVTPRKLLQIFGTELFQYDIYLHLPELANKVPERTLWINRFRLIYEDTVKKIGMTPDTVISDIRFPHEAEVIKDMGGFVVRVLRSDSVADTHSSEMEMLMIKEDYTLYNTGDFDYLYDQIEVMIDKFLEKGCENC